jgi:hypothetical protein
MTCNKFTIKSNNLALIVWLFSSLFILTGSLDAQLPTRLILKSAPESPVIDSKNPDVISSHNKSGFETGQVIKIGDTYHMFINEMFDRPHKDMRIAYWTSKDALHWHRKSTIVNSIPGRTATNPRAEVWVTGVKYNHLEDAWNIFYVAYRAGDSTKAEIAGNDYAGRIWRAKSTVNGTGGIAGPYADMGIVLEPDSNSQRWEGQQAVACFNPYKVGNTWYAMYDGHNHVPRGPWPTGMAFAKKLSGPWTRMPEGFNPIGVAKVFMENEVVSKLKDGRYMMVFDSFGDQQIGYSLSSDGLHWTGEQRVKVQFQDHIWAENGDHSTRTPLCAIEQEDGSFAVIYTALTTKGGKKFFAVGRCTLVWDK